jgi:hypothetical protein
MPLPNIISEIDTIKSTYLPLSGSKTINSSLTTSTYLNGNKGISIINSNVTSGAYTTLWRYPSTNGVFTISGYKGLLQAFYTGNDIIAEGTNSVTKTLTLLDESGNSSFPGTVTGTFNGLCTKATGDASGNTITTSYASSASLSGASVLLKSKSGATLSTVTFKNIVTTTYKSGANWYRVWSDGFIEQGGRASVGHGGTFSLLKAFTTTNYNILFTTETSDAHWIISAFTRTVSNFKTNVYWTTNYSTGTVTAYWYACGY